MGQKLPLRILPHVADRKSRSADDDGRTKHDVPRHPRNSGAFEANTAVRGRSADRFGQSFASVHSNLAWSPIEFLEDIRESRGRERIWSGDFAFLLHYLGNEERACWRWQARSAHDDTV